MTTIQGYGLPREDTPFTKLSRGRRRLVGPNKRRGPVRATGQPAAGGAAAQSILNNIQSVLPGGEATQPGVQLPTPVAPQGISPSPAVTGSSAAGQSAANPLPYVNPTARINQQRQQLAQSGVAPEAATKIMQARANQFAHKRLQELEGVRGALPDHITQALNQNYASPAEKWRAVSALVASESNAAGQADPRLWWRGLPRGAY